MPTRTGFSTSGFSQGQCPSGSVGSSLELFGQSYGYPIQQNRTPGAESTKVHAACHARLSPTQKATWTSLSVSFKPHRIYPLHPLPSRNRSIFQPQNPLYVLFGYQNTPRRICTYVVWNAENPRGPTTCEPISRLHKVT